MATALTCIGTIVLCIVIGLIVDWPLLGDDVKCAARWITNRFTRND